MPTGSATGSANVTDSKPDKPAIPEAESRPKAPERSADLGDVLQAEGLDPSDPRVTDAVRKVIAISATQQIRGPLPSGQEKILYGQADPSLPDRIFEDAEIRRDHRHKLEVLDSEAENRRLDRAQWAAVSLAGLSIIAALIYDEQYRFRLLACI